jgi:hypothetical protein
MPETGEAALTLSPDVFIPKAYYSWYAKVGGDLPVFFRQIWVN